MRGDWPLARMRLPEEWADVSTKRGALFNAAMRTCLFPLYLVQEVLELPERVTYDEPSNYWARRLVRKVDSIQPLLTSAGRLEEEGDGEGVGGAVPGMGFKIILRRFVECWRESGMLAWQSVLYLGVLLPLVSILGFEHVGRLWKPDIETLLAFLTGRYTELSDGKRAPLSIANLMDGSFETPGYQPRTHFPAAVSRGLAGPGTATSAGPDGAGAEVPAQACNGVPHQACSGVFPRACNGLADKACGQGPAVSCNGLPDQANEAALAGSCDGLPDQACEGRPAGLTLPDEALWGPVDSPLNAHFLSLCSKLMYEERDVVRDVVSQRWGMEWYGYGRIPAGQCGEGYVPDMVWACFGNGRAAVLAFKGAEPLHQIDRQTDIPVSMSFRPGLGRVNDGFYRGLLQRDVENPGQTLYQTLLNHMKSMTEPRRVFFTGHSLGGAAAVTFAALLACREPASAQRVGGVVTFGAPRIGDADFCSLLATSYPGRVFRYVHASDMVAKLPAGFDYVDHSLERFIVSHPAPPACRILREEDGPALLDQRRRRDDVWAYSNSVAKLLRSIAAGQTAQSTTRMVTLVLPGICDHFPSEYEQALREVVLLDVHQSRAC